MRPLKEIGTLRMYSSRGFRICNECVNFMWHERHPVVWDET